MDRAWHERHPEYDGARRLTAKLSRAAEKKVASVLSPPPLMPGLAWDVVQDAIGVQATEILGEVVRLGARRAQDAMRAQVAEIRKEFGGLPPRGAQDAMASGGPAQAP
jgi:hypothetical protein